MRREVKLGDILEYEQPNMYIVKNTNYDKKFDTPVLTAGQSFILGYTNEKENIFKAKENPVIIFDDFTTASKYVDFDFKVKSSAMKILKAREGINIKYIYYAMKNIKFDNQLHKRYWISEYSKIKLLIPDIKMQEKIVKELDLVIKVLDYKKKQIKLFDELIKSQFVEMFELEKYELEMLGGISNFIDYRGKTPTISDDKEVRIVNAKSVGKGFFKYIDEYITEDLYEKWMKRGVAYAGDVLFVTEGHTFGNTCLIPDGIERFALGQRVITIQGKEKLNNIYLCYYMQLDEFINKINIYKTGGTAKGIRSKDLAKITIPVPPITLQNEFSEIVKRIDKQKFEIEKSLKETQELYESLMEKYFG